MILYSWILLHYYTVILYYYSVAIFQWNGAQESINIFIVYPAQSATIMSSNMRNT